MVGLICMVRGHRRSKNVWHDTLDYRSKCIHCKIPLIRDVDGWRPFDPERDHHPERASKTEVLQL